MGDLLAWYGTEARPLPWRVAEVSPWEILLAEVILQQTRMETGLPYWERIRRAYPTPAALASVPVEDLLLLWQGCGYYARARNLHRCAVELGERPLPSTHEALLSLPGIGPYTAAAVASVAFGEAVACVDGNVRRVLSRLAAAHLTDAEVAADAEARLDRTRPGDWNQALMELGSRICTPRNPNCGDCPLSTDCEATRTADPTIWPARRGVKQRRVQATALLVEGPGGLLLHRREGRSLGGLWGVPLSEEDASVLGQRETRLLGRVRHDFTHKRFEIEVHLASAEPEDVMTAPDSVPLSTLDRKIIALASEA